MRRPFASVVMRTRGNRLVNLREALACLSRQSDADFEVIVVANDGSSPVIRGVLDSFPRHFRRRVSIIPAPPGGRTPPLNAGLDRARGAYVAFLDDDDLVTDDWMEAFHDAARQSPGLVVRSGSLSQRVRRNADGTYERLGEPVAEFGPPEFDLADHLVDNRSPNFSWAAPLGRVRAAGIRFDESLPVLEDWDFLVRCAVAFGVHSTGRTTGTYHRWETGEASLDEHGAVEWAATRCRIQAGFEARLGAEGLVTGLADSEMRLAQNGGASPGRRD